MMAVCYVLYCWRLCELLSIQLKDFGLLLIIFKKILVKDVVPFMLFSLIFCGSFGIAFSSIYKRDRYNSYIELVFGFMDGFDYDSIFTDRRGFLFNMTCVIAVVGFFFVTTIIMLNLLIAAMSETYSAVRHEADTEWKARRTNLVKEYFFLDAIPPPFNIVNDLISFFFFNTLGRFCKRKKHSHDQIAKLKSWNWNLKSAEMNDNTS
jgi:hypothetical protein